MRVREFEEEATDLPKSGLDGLDSCLDGSIPRGQLTEIIEKSGGGAGLVMAALLSQARRDRQYAILFDVGQGFTVESFPEEDLEALLWVGCNSAGEAIEALDIASRDENFALFLLDFRNCEAGEWRSVRSQQWYRVVGQMRQRNAAAVLFADTPVTSVSKRKLAVDCSLNCEALDRDRSFLWQQLKFSSTALGESGDKAGTARSQNSGATTKCPGSGRFEYGQKVG